MCKAVIRREVKDHSFEDYIRDEFLTEMIKRGADQIERIEEPRYE